MSGVGIALFVVDAFVALTAIGGGAALVAGLERSRFPDEWLKRTPFRSYVLPGLILAMAVGGSAALAAAATLADEQAGVLSIAAGAILAGYVLGEIRLLDQPSRWTWTEALYLGLALSMVLLGSLHAA